MSNLSGFWGVSFKKINKTMNLQQLLLIAVLLLFTHYACSDEQSFDLSGYARVVGAVLDNSDAEYSDYDDSLKFDNDSLLGLQGKFYFNDKFSAAALFQQELQAQSMRKMLIANSLSNALRDDEFKVFYQPKVDSSGRVNGMEALIRWQSCFDGNIAPNEFIPVAEHCGKITAITRWMLKRVFKDLSKMVDLVGAPVKVSINLSANDI